jgi:hypothetical protein
MGSTVIIGKGDISAEINMENSQMFSLSSKGIEVMWNGGAPEARRARNGWQNSEFIMFPIIGAANNNTVLIEGKKFPMGKHGITRDLPWHTIFLTSSSARMTQTYEAGQEVKNSKGFISVFPKSFMLTKTYSIENKKKFDGLQFVFRLDIEPLSDYLPYAAGWHPGFRNYGGVIEVVDKSVETMISEKSVMESEGNAIMLRDSSSVRYRNSKFGLTIRHDFGHTQAWDRGEGLVAIEPVSAEALSHVPDSGSGELGSLRGYRRLARGSSQRFTAEIEINA